MPNDVRMDDGFSTIITIANLPSVKLYEKEVTPPGMTAGGAIDTTTMRSNAWRQMSPRQLKTLSPMSATVAYATEVIPQVRDQLAVNQLITVTFPDDSILEFYGWIEEFTPGAFTEGEQPTATLTIQPSLTDPSTGLTVAPVYFAASGQSAQ